MIRRVTIRDFQRHELLRVDLDQGVTAIVGPSDAGKSSVIRAVRWVLFNEPLGFQMIRDGAKCARVCLTFDDGTYVERKRGKKVNRYEVGDGNGPTEQYDDFGRGVPEIVALRLGVRPVELAGRLRELNCQTQHEPPFMLGWTARERSAVLDLLAGNDVLDEVVRRLNAKVQAAGRAKSSLESRRERLEGELEAFGDLDAERRRISVLDWEVEEAVARLEAVEAMAALADRIDETDSSLSASRAEESGLPPDLSTSVGTALEEASVVDSLIGLGRGLADVAKTLEEVRAEAAGLPGEIDLDPLLGRLTDYEVLASLLREHSASEAQVGNHRSEVTEVEAELEALVSKRSRLLEEAGSCPTCGRATTGREFDLAKRTAADPCPHRDDSSCSACLDRLELASLVLRSEP